MTPVVEESADEQQQDALQAIKQGWGVVPNLGRVLALSLPLTRAALSFDEALEHGSIPAPVGEQIAIAVANINQCSYCLAAHSMAAGLYKVSDQDIADARTGDASDPWVAAVLQFARAVVERRGFVRDEQLQAARAAGVSEATMVEIVGHVAANTLTNYLHHLSQVPVDYPPVDFA
ncbi:carboxymuconolactone decarboxylase family protein [Mycolicibacterium sp.]|uniref:carboxymuconolactone decarboxylase family protein n=1 Tax=Mycolicibacterium sp. TaxID=2320850 RepID=UPI003D0B6575